jgi:hypothetical protein
LGESQVRKCDFGKLLPERNAVRAKSEKGPEEPALSEFCYCSLSDWPTSWNRTLRWISEAVNGILQTACHGFAIKKPRLFKGAASQQGGSHHQPERSARPDTIRLAQ